MKVTDDMTKIACESYGSKLLEQIKNSQPPNTFDAIKAALESVLNNIDISESPTEWIKWDGGECPVDNDTLVDVRFANNKESHGYDASGWFWKNRDDCLGIVAYRLSKKGII